MTLSVIMVTENSVEVVEGAIKSVAGVWDELLVGDGGSTDGTVEIVRRYGATIIEQKDAGSRVKPGMTTLTLGERKQELVERAKGDWILVLDADERVSPKLAQEIRRITNHHKIMHVHKNVIGRSDGLTVAYRIPYQNYVFGKPVFWGGEKYAKVRLFRKGFAKISLEPLHEDVIIKTEKSGFRLKGRNDNFIGELKGIIHHHSYRSPWQLFVKFTRYAWIAAGEIREKEKERRLDSRFRGNDTTLKKLFLYSPHMVWARYIKEKGYKDGWRGLVLALAFGYMEGLTYWMLLFKLIRKNFYPGSPRSRG